MRKYISYFLSILPSFIFCLRVLPFSQALKLPILLHNPKLYSVKGVFIINTNCVKFGMIKLGFNLVPLYKDTGIMIQNDGRIEFNGNCNIGSGSSLSVGKSGVLSFGEFFGASANFRLACIDSIKFGKNVLFGYECLIIDNDMHALTSLNGDKQKGYAPIVIGENNWIGARCTILKNTITPSYCTIAAGSLLSTTYLKLGEYNVIGSQSSIRVLKEGLYRDPNSDIILV